MKRLVHCLILLAISSSSLGQGTIAGVPDSDYRLGGGDLIRIRVFGVEEFDYSVRIGSSGTITLPYLGSMTASGKTAVALAQDLEAAMEGRLFKNPMIVVEIQEYRANQVVMLGAINKPGTYQLITSGVTLVDMIGQAGGLSGDVGEEIVIQRKHGNEDEPEVISIQVSDIFGRSSSMLNLEVLGGDVINISRLGPADLRQFYVVGDVGRPGVFDLSPDRDIFLTQAVATAGGALKTAKLDKGLLVRYGDDGNRTEIAFNFKKMLKGEQIDVTILPKDIIFIPSSTGKALGYGMIGAIPGLATAIAISAIPR